MSTSTARQPKGIPVGGQFAATTHDEPGVTLTAPARLLPELAPYGQIPAPLESQTLEDGSPAEATFEASYRAFFRELYEHESAQGPYESTPGISEAEILDLAGIGDANLGRHRGTSLERDEDTDQPVIVVHTRNGGGNRECYQDDCDGNCTGCIQTDTIPALPTYLRDEDDDGDSTYANNYFRPVDPAAGRAALEAEEQRSRLNRLVYFRQAITAGSQPPWVVLSPVRGREERAKILDALSRARGDATRSVQTRRTSEAVFAALESEGEMPETRLMRVPRERSTYDIALKERAKYTGLARDARQAADALAAEMKLPLPPATAELVEREHARLDKDAVGYEKEVAENQAKIEFAGGVMRSWAWTLKEQAGESDASVAVAEEKLKDFDWSASWPGAVNDCPPRPRD